MLRRVWVSKIQSLAELIKIRRLGLRHRSPSLPEHLFYCRIALGPFLDPSHIVKLYLSPVFYPITDELNSQPCLGAEHIVSPITISLVTDRP